MSDKNERDKRVSIPSLGQGMATCNNTYGSSTQLILFGPPILLALFFAKL